MLTQTAKYAIRALMYLADREINSYCQTKEIADSIKVPANYLGKTLQKLAHARVLDSQKGLHGGFRTSRPSSEITLQEILVAIEAIPREVHAEDASNEDVDLPSGVYAKFAELSQLYYKFLRKTTLADLMEDAVESDETSVAAQ